jgi:hypothetical protein
VDLDNREDEEKSRFALNPRIMCKRRPSFRVAVLQRAGFRKFSSEKLQRIEKMAAGRRDQRFCGREKGQIARKGCDVPPGSEIRVRRRDQSAISQPAFNKNLSKGRDLLHGYHCPLITILNHLTNRELSVSKCSNSSFVIQTNRLFRADLEKIRTPKHRTKI